MEELNKQHVQVPNMDLAKEGLSINDPYVYACIKRYMNNETKEAFPSVSKLVIDSGLNKSTVTSCINRLHQQGYISIIKEFGKVNHYKFNDYKKFEIYSYDFLDDPKYTSKEKSYLVATQSEMFKNSDTEKGYISYSSIQLADKLNVSLPTLKKIEKSLQTKGALTLLPIKTRDTITGLRNYERVYSFKEFSNLLAIKFQQTDDKLEEHENRIQKLENRIEQLIKENKILTSAYNESIKEKDKPDIIL